MQPPSYFGPCSSLSAHRLFSRPTMSAATDHSAKIQAFLAKWQASGAGEKANAQSFLNELCDILEVERPHPKKNDEAANSYVFEKTIPSVTDTSNFIDLYKRGCFVLETKQGADAARADDPQPLSAAGIARKKNLKTGHGLWRVRSRRSRRWRGW